MQEIISWYFILSLFYVISFKFLFYSILFCIFLSVCVCNQLRLSTVLINEYEWMNLLVNTMELDVNA